jgi:hypothetical protein
MEHRLDAQRLVNRYPVLAHKLGDHGRRSIWILGHDSRDQLFATSHAGAMPFFFSHASTRGMKCA